MTYLTPNTVYAPAPREHGVRPLRAAETSLVEEMMALRELAEEIVPPIRWQHCRGPQAHPRSPYARDRALAAMQVARDNLEVARRERIKRHRGAAAWYLALAAEARREVAHQLRMAARYDEIVRANIERMCRRWEMAK